MNGKKLNLEERLAKLQGVLAQIDAEQHGVKAVEDAEDLYLKLWTSVREHAKVSTIPNARKAITIFHEAYQIHRDKHGSYKNILGSVEYAKHMSERYLFCYEQAMKYLNRDV